MKLYINRILNGKIFDISRLHEFMKFGSIKTKNSRIPVLPRLAWRKRRLASLRKCGMEF